MKLFGYAGKVNALREWWLSSPECSLRGVSKPRSATGEEVDGVVIVPERSEWDTVRRSCDRREGVQRRVVKGDLSPVPFPNGKGRLLAELQVKGGDAFPRYDRGIERNLV